MFRAIFFSTWIVNEFYREGEGDVNRNAVILLDVFLERRSFVTLHCFSGFCVDYPFCYPKKGVIQVC